LKKPIFILTPIELKRLAKSNDQLAKTLFSAEAYGNELKVLLWLIIGLCAAGGFVLFARVAPSLFGFWRLCSFCGWPFCGYPERV